MALRTLCLLAVSVGLGLCAVGCATGDDGVTPRGGDGAVRRDAGRSDAGPSDCTPPCPVGETCRFAVCVSATDDGDGDGVPATLDCDDGDASVGRTAQRPCAGACGDGVERCTDGVWEPCSAPTSCDCAAGSPARLLDCGTCGTQRQACVDGTWIDDGPCTEAGTCAPGESEDGPACGCGGLQRRTCRADCSWGGFECVGGGGECTEGMVDTETRACASGSGTETRQRTCETGCTWGDFAAWEGCPTGPMCGDGTCESGEMCATCADCQFGHMGTGDNMDPCADAPLGQWRCVTDPGLRVVSQVCTTRDGAQVWININLDPRDCAACVCTESLACCRAGQTDC